MARGAQGGWPWVSSPVITDTKEQPVSDEGVWEVVEGGGGGGANLHPPLRQPGAPRPLT